MLWSKNGLRSGISLRRLADLIASDIISGHSLCDMYAFLFQINVPVQDGTKLTNTDAGVQHETEVVQIE